MIVLDRSVDADLMVRLLPRNAGERAHPEAAPRHAGCVGHVRRVVTGLLRVEATTDPEDIWQVIRRAALDVVDHRAGGTPMITVVVETCSDPSRSIRRPDRRQPTPIRKQAAIERGPVRAEVEATRLATMVRAELRHLGGTRCPGLEGPLSRATLPLGTARGAARRFLDTEVAGGVFLVVASLVAFVWANSPVAGAYVRLWSTPLTIGVGSHQLSMDARGWANDGLITLFFLMVGLELKREITLGELRDPRVAGWGYATYSAWEHSVGSGSRCRSSSPISRSPRFVPRIKTSWLSWPQRSSRRSSRGSCSVRQRRMTKSQRALRYRRRR